MTIYVRFSFNYVGSKLLGDWLRLVDKVGNSCTGANTVWKMFQICDAKCKCPKKTTKTKQKQKQTHTHNPPPLPDFIMLITSFCCCCRCFIYLSVVCLFFSFDLTHEESALHAEYFSKCDWRWNYMPGLYAADGLSWVCLHKIIDLGMLWIDYWPGDVVDRLLTWGCCG